ncbi:MAG: hypothetical protein EGS41_03715 [Prevotella sp.]|nr:hypothetical protein [Prevotella sp.]
MIFVFCSLFIYAGFKLTIYNNVIARAKIGKKFDMFKLRFTKKPNSTKMRVDLSKNREWHRIY